ncbi:hypothetical protein [Pricia sp.]|uniref:hypothetical protein n=1 Tax=Pricia sp. TaxID=2268138 RepID=UPI00359358A1
MNSIFKIMSWKRTIHFSVAVLALLIIFDFYGLYTNNFFFLKPENYVFPVITLIHFTFLYVLKFKITENELTDPLMRNIEYMLYAAFLIYVFKTSEILYTLTSYDEFVNYVMPVTFLPLGISIFVLHLLLLVLTILAIQYRKEMVGEYKFDDMNQHIDTWE